MERKEIKITIDEKDMNAIEDIFFCDLNENEYSKIRPRLVKIWEKLCGKMKN